MNKTTALIVQDSTEFVKIKNLFSLRSEHFINICRTSKILSAFPETPMVPYKVTYEIVPFEQANCRITSFLDVVPIDRPNRELHACWLPKEFRRQYALRTVEAIPTFWSKIKRLFKK